MITLQTVWTQIRTGVDRTSPHTSIFFHILSFRNEEFWQKAEYCLTLGLLVSSADNFCKQFGPRSDQILSVSGSKLFDTLMVFLIFF